MRVTSRAGIFAVAASFALLVAGCGDSDDSSSTTTEQSQGGGDDTTTTEAQGAEAVAPEDNGGRKEGDGELVLGAVLPQTGRLGQLGPPMIRAVAMAERDINEAGGVLDKDIRIITKDDGGGSDDDLASSAVDELVNNEDIDGLVGAASSDTTKAILDRVVSSGTVECSPSNTGSDLTQADDKGLYFRTPPPDDLQSLALAKAVTDDGHQNVAIIAQNTDYGTGFVRFLEPALRDAGPAVVESVTYDPDGTGIDAEVEKLVNAEPEAVVLIGYPEDGGKVLTEMIRQDAGPDKVTVYVTDGMQSNELYKAVDEDDPAVTAGIRGTAPSAAPEGGASFFPDAFKTFAPEVESPIFSAQSYDCVIVMALAAQKAESDAPYDIAREMINITKGESDDAETCDTYAACLQLLKDGKDINYEGAAGALDFSEFGEPSAGEYEVYTFGDDGTYAVDERITVADEE